MALDLTGFGYVGVNPDDRIKTTSGSTGTLAVFSLNPGYGGFYTVGVATAAMTKSGFGGDVVCVDTTTDDGLTPLASANSKLVQGVYLAYFGAGGEAIFQSLASGGTLVSAVSGTRVAILVDGVADVVADGTVSRGDLLVNSGTIAGRVIANNSAAAGTIIGRARQAATVGVTFRASIFRG